MIHCAPERYWHIKHVLSIVVDGCFTGIVACLFLFAVVALLSFVATAFKK